LKPSALRASQNALVQVRLALYTLLFFTEVVRPWQPLGNAKNSSRCHALRICSFVVPRRTAAVFALAQERWAKALALS